MMVVSVRSPTIGPAELATIANRVVNCLSRQGQIQPNERENIFSKAIKFVGVAEGGDEIMKTGRLRSNASDNLRSYGWITQAFAFLSSKSQRPSPEDFAKDLKELRKTLAALAEGKSIPKDRNDEVKELFTFLRRIALAINTLPTDKITIGSFETKIPG